MSSKKDDSESHDRPDNNESYIKEKSKFSDRSQLRGLLEPYANQLTHLPQLSQPSLLTL
jgi:hypothetical protein